MVLLLLAGSGPEGGGARCPSPPAPADPEDDEGCEDARSLATDDAFYPPGGGERGGAGRGAAVPGPVPEPVPEAAAALLRAAGANDVELLRALVRRGPRPEEVRETDRNGRTCLLVACYHGFVDVVVVLAECPHVDVNWQDSEGNTALITAAQAGHATITNYLLNYFPGVDLERRNVFGFTALMKAAMQGRTECIRALMLAGADVDARDPRRGLSPQEWAAFTGRAEAARLMQRLLERPCPEQLGDRYRPEWPPAAEAAAKQAASKTCLERLRRFLRSALAARPRGPEDGGALDHMVRMTTGLRSPAVAIACQTVCPDSPPRVGKRRRAVPEILAAREAAGEAAGAGAGAGAGCAPAPPLPAPAAAPRKPGLRPLQRLRRGSVRPGVVVPRVRVSKAPAPTFQPERAAGTKDSAHLQIPKWRYKEAKEERRRAEEAERQRQAAAQRERKRAPRWRKRT
ncbi:ankyrin repeat domain-containing protein 33B [Dipodomys merriami]|uniref:ankyrin repeat domain-containing protein 33B n=1 Tax=Dipodomys merriami TaxID=94247 RepID=UPI003855AEF0